MKQTRRLIGDVKVKGFAFPRRGHDLSLVDAIANALWRVENAWPERTFREILDYVQKLTGSNLEQAAIRGAIYSREDLFEKVPDKAPVKYRLTKAARSGPSRSY